MIVVSDASPITNLATIGRLDLLLAVHGSVVVPQAVHRELLQASPPIDVTRDHEGIEVRAASNAVAIAALAHGLDPGEAEAIALAVELKADLLLIDERRGREAARRLGLPVMGLVGTLMVAKERSLIPAVRPVMDELIQRAGFWVSDALYAAALKAACEDTGR